jgi:DNA polymerase (family 10)
MDKHAVALALEEIGTLLRLQGENRFKARAFTTAARAIEKLDTDLDALISSGELERTPALGPATARVVRELVETGEARYLEDLRARTPAGLRELLAVPGLGTRKVEQLHDELGIQTLDDLEAAAQSGSIAQLRGFGERTQARILEGISFVRGTSGRRRSAPALLAANRLLGFLRAQPGIERVEIAGELRRGLETVEGVDFVVAADRDMCDAVLESFLALSPAARGERTRDGARASLADGLALCVRCVRPERFATAWTFATGAPAHLEALQRRAEALGLALDADGLHGCKRRVPLDDEPNLYGALDLQWVPPELREDAAGVALAAAGALPALVTYDDLRGCFHCHTVYSDGRATLAEMAEAAAARGWSYLGIADHSQNAGYAGGLTAADIRRQHAEIDAWNARHGRRIRLFKGVEADILADGSLDYADEPGVLESFDYVIGSVHSRFRMSRAEMTARVLRAVDDPRLTILGHPTGRLLLTREAYALDVAAVLERAAQRGVGVEINSDPHRLDLDWRHWPAAKARGVRAAINPDAHSAESLDYVRYGVVMARKGGLEAADVINTRTTGDVQRMLRRTG